VDRPSKYCCELPEELDAVSLRALEPEPARRYQTAAEMADALERAVPPASSLQVAEWVQTTAGVTLARRAELLAVMEAPKPPNVFGSLRRGTYGTVAVAVLAGVLATGAVGSFLARSSPADAAITPVAAPAAIVANRLLAKLPGPVDDRAKAAVDVAAQPPVGAKNAAPDEPPFRHAPRRPPTRAPSASPPKDFCNPPYDVNDDGIRIYKRACL
jgi:serine/threonine-protein kinase